MKPKLTLEHINAFQEDMESFIEDSKLPIYWGPFVKEFCLFTKIGLKIKEAMENYGDQLNFGRDPEELLSLIYAITVNT